MPPLDRRGEIGVFVGQLDQWNGWISQESMQEWLRFAQDPFHVSPNLWPLYHFLRDEDDEDTTSEANESLQQERQINQVRHVTC